MKIKTGKKPQNDIKTNIELKKEMSKVIFSFKYFKPHSIVLDGSFNNHYKDESHYIKVASSLMKALALYSNECMDELTKDKSKSKSVHCHTLTGNQHKIVEKILEKYDMSSDLISNIMEDDIYQIALQKKRDSMRLVAAKVDNQFLPLFIDVNHHIYLNGKLVGDSLGFETCPIHAKEKCEIMKYEKTCYMYEYVDEKKITESYNYSYKDS